MNMDHIINKSILFLSDENVTFLQFQRKTKMIGNGSSRDFIYKFLTIIVLFVCTYVYTYAIIL